MRLCATEQTVRLPRTPECVGSLTITDCITVCNMYASKSASKIEVEVLKLSPGKISTLLGSILVTV